LHAGKVSSTPGATSPINRLARSQEIRKSSWGTRTPSLRGALAMKQSRGRVLWPLDCFAARNGGGVDAAIIGHGLASATSIVSWLEEHPVVSPFISPKCRRLTGDARSKAS
jgi:hypothetical protein